MEARYNEAQTYMKSEQIRGQIDIKSLKTSTMKVGRQKAKIDAASRSHCLSLPALPKVKLSIGGLST
jgi:hypothetical protein